MVLMIAGLVVFFAIHLLPTQPDVRAGMIERFGEGGYKGFFTIVSLVGFALIVFGYGKMQGELGSKNPVIWYPPVWTQHLAPLLMIPSLILLAAAYIPSNIKRIVGHPMLAAVKLWAFAHLLVNGNLADVLLFGGFLAWAVADRISVKRRPARPIPGAPARPANDAIAVVAGLALYALFVFWAHGALIGVPLVAPR